MRNTLLLLCLALVCLTDTQAGIYHRGDKISDHFKQLDLAPEEIDPNVAPSAPGNIEMFDETTDEMFNGNMENEILDESDNEIIDESVNEISQSVATLAPVAATTVVATTVAAVTVAAPVDTATPVKAEGETSGLAKYCKCKGNHCDCCREFNFPFIPVKGPGCARMTYLGNERMSVSLKYGDLTLASRTVSSRRARPICVGLPGGYSQFCGRMYGLSKAKESFKACLGFELRADDEVEAALRVSCFKFGPDGLRVAEAEPLPVEVNKEEDDDDDDIFGFGAGADDEEDEDDYDEDDNDEEEAEDDTDSDADYADDDAGEEAAAGVDYGGFSLDRLLDDLEDDDDEDSKPSFTPALTAASSDAVTRTAIDTVQSKDVKDTLAVTAPSLEPTETVAPVASAATAVTTVADQVTSAPESTANTTAKTKKSKKAKKNKRKKAADTEGDYAYDIINGLLDFFN